MGLLGHIVTAVLFAYLVYCLLLFYHLFFPKECIPRSGSRRPSLACLRSELDESDMQNLQLRVYNSLSSKPNSFVQEILRVENFSMISKLDLDVEFPVPPSTRNNGSMWVHAFIIPPVDVNVPGQAPWHVVQTAKMTVYAHRKRERVLVQSPVEEQNWKSEYEPPITHLRSVLTLRGVGKPFSFDHRKVSYEMNRVIVLTERDRYLPLFYLDWLCFRTNDLVPIEPNASMLHLKVRYIPVSVGHLYFVLSLRESLRQLKSIGFQQSDIDELLNMFGDVDMSVIMLTMVVATVHILLDFMAFRDDVNFWRTKSSMEGLSRRTLIWRLFSELVVLLYLVNTRASILITIPVFFGLLIELWKITKAFKLTLSRGAYFVPKIGFGQVTQAESETDELDSEGMRYLFFVMGPICVLGALYSLFYMPHNDWYSWLVQSLANGIYLFGFVFMMPQLFVNYRLKSVAHMPWKTFMYKAFNTFIDDVFAFVFKMPMAHRLACFRDDVIFLIYLYQRWLYPVDKNRMNEFGLRYEKQKPIETISWRPSFRRKEKAQ